MNKEIDQLRDISVGKFFNFSRPIVRPVLVKCPFHNDSTPSMALYPDNGFHCFGCQAHGKGSIDFIMQLGPCSFKEACNELKKYL